LSFNYTTVKSGVDLSRIRNQTFRLWQEFQKDAGALQLCSVVFRVESMQTYIWRVWVTYIWRAWRKSGCVCVV